MRRGSAAGRPSAAAPAAAPAAPSHSDTPSPRAHPDPSRPCSATAAPPCCCSSTLRRKSVAHTSRPSSAFLPHGRHPHEPPRIAQPFSYQRARPASACPSCRRRASAPGAPAGRSAEAGGALPSCEELAASRRADERAREAARCASTVSHITWVMREQLRAHMHLELSGMTDSNIHQVAESLRENSSITSLNLSFCPGIRDKGAFKLGKALKGNTTVVHVNLAGCTGITDEGAEDLCVQLVDHPSVRVISFAGCWDLGDRLASACARCLAPELSSGLRSINLSGCRLTDEGLTCIATALWENVSLERLQLQGCLSISEAGFVALGEALEHNTSVRFIDLSWCEELTDRSLLRIGSALEQNYTLHKLKLTCCFRITDAGVKMLAKALENNNSLKELDLSWCANIGRSAGAVVALSSALQKNHTLTSVDLTGCACNTSSSDRTAVAMTELKLLLDRNSKRPKSFATTLLMKEPLATTGNRSRRSLPANPRDSSARVHNHFDPIATDSIRLMLKTAITRGAQLFNAEDSEACFHLFVGTAKTLTGMVHFQPLENALKRSSDYTLDIKSRTWKLRTVFDEILEELEDDSRE